LNIARDKIANLEDYHEYIDDIKSGKIDRFDIEGGDGHLALKLLARDYLQGQKTNFEIEFDGYFPDVITFNKKVIIECGNTNPDKILNYFKNKKLEQVIVIPYPSYGEKDIIGYIFKPSVELTDFLIFREKELLRNTVQRQ